MPGLIRSFKGLIRPRGVSLNASSISVEETKTYQLVATITPDGVKNKKIKWVSSDPSVATVDDTGLITAITAGSTTITVTTDDRGFTDSCSCEIYVVPITSFQLNKSTTSITYGNTEQLSVTIVPNNATYQGVTWTSSNPSVATVDENGLVTPVWEGNCTITATSNDGEHSANCAITVNIIHVTGISLNKNSVTINAGEQEQLTATITPSNANIKTVTWSSSDTGVAVVDETGLVTYVGDGNCTITATTVDGGYTATCSAECSSFTPIDCRFGYTGAEQSITLQPHEYCLEVWGANGGNKGGLGGYSSGCITLYSDTTIYIYVGQCGSKGYTSGTFNGGGRGGCGGQGGGGTDIRIGGNTLCHRRIVAGGGGGGDTGWVCYAGGVGGGCTGGNVANGKSNSAAGQGGTQTSGGSVLTSGSGRASSGGFGTGGYGSCSDSSSFAVVGGGGGRYGGGGGQANGGGGGSGYVYTSSTCSNAPSGYCHCSDYFLTNAYSCCGAVSFPSPSGGTETGHTGCGCVRIRSL